MTSTAKWPDINPWRPVHTAPTNGRPVEVAWIVNPPTVEKIVRTRWIGGQWAGGWTPTHWRAASPQDDSHD